jgi:predicted site-specific integrase-resolvase
MQEDLDSFTGRLAVKPEKLTIVYARCSTAKQKENLERQKDRLTKHAESQGYKYMVSVLGDMVDRIGGGDDNNNTKQN